MTAIHIDVDKLRAYMIDYCGTAMFSGFPAAIVDLADIEIIDGATFLEILDEQAVDKEDRLTSPYPAKCSL